MSIQKKEISGNEGNNNSTVYSIQSGQETEYAFILRNSTGRYDTVSYYSCDLEDLKVLVRDYISDKTRNIAVLVNIDLDELRKALNEPPLYGKVNPNFFAANQR